MSASRPKPTSIPSSRSCRGSDPGALLRSETLLGFGLTYAIEVFRVAASDLAWGAQSPNGGFVVYFAAHVVVAVAIVLSGFWVLLKSRAKTSEVGAG